MIPILLRTSRFTDIPRNLFALAACLLAASSAADDILDARTGQTMSRAALLEKIAGADWLLLGERHDNPRHHAARAELLLDLKTRRVVMEHLEQGRALNPGLPLESALDAVEYNRKGWRWPMQQPLFEALRQIGASVHGGNLSRADGRQIAIQGEAAVAPELAALIAAAPLPEAAQARLDASLIEGHCGQLPAARLPNMRLAQRARDAAMARVLLDTPGTAVLLAGNGHVRLDFGVPSLLRAAAPSARVVSIGFVESAREGEAVAYDYLWVTQPAERPDPCAGMKLP
jgi:uncharacterized iron-regulated protein